MKTNTISKLSFLLLVMLILTSCEKEKLQNRIIYTKHDTTITSVVKFDTLFCDIFPYVNILAPIPLESEVIYAFDVDQDDNNDFKIEISSGIYDTSFCWPFEMVTFFGLGENQFFFGLSENQFYSPNYYYGCNSLSKGDSIKNTIENKNWYKIWSAYDEHSWWEHSHICKGTYYLGIRISKNDLYYYGWLKTTVSRLSCEILESAINSQPNIPIIVGDT